MAIEDSTQIALSILQTVGLLVPVVFLALRHHFREEASIPWSSPSSEVGEEIDIAPRELKLGWLAVAAFTVSGLFAAFRVLLAVIGS